MLTESFTSQLNGLPWKFAPKEFSAGRSQFGISKMWFEESGTCKVLVAENWCSIKTGYRGALKPLNGLAVKDEDVRSPAQDIGLQKRPRMSGAISLSRRDLLRAESEGCSIVNKAGSNAMYDGLQGTPKGAAG